MIEHPKVLVLDLETKPAKVYTFSMWDANFTPEHIIEDGGMICFGAKWLGQKEMLFYSEWEHGQYEMVKAAHELLSEADAVVTYNGDKFDLRKLRGEMILQGLKPPPPPTSIDVIKSVKKLGFAMNRLAYIGPLLEVGRKVKHEGFSLWVGVMNGNENSRNKMRRYCIQDVRLLERLYKKIRPYIDNHPHLGAVKAHACGACGSHNVQKRGFRRTRSFRIQRLQCQSCGSWQNGTMQKVV
jgi:hypothetical protein